MWPRVIGCEPVGLFKAKEEVKVKLNAYCEFLYQNFPEWVH